MSNPSYCSTYCEHNAAGECDCQPCVFIRTQTGFKHAPGCRRRTPATDAEIEAFKQWAGRLVWDSKQKRYVLPDPD
jgi:hypothetical protein